MLPPEIDVPKDVFVDGDEDYDTDELERIRERWFWSPGGTGDFYCCQRGGKWTLAHKKVITDAAAGLARNGLPKAWCRAFRMPVMSSFSYRQFSEEAANMMAQEHCRRCQWFYRMYFESDDEDFTYSDEQLQSYRDQLRMD